MDAGVERTTVKELGKLRYSWSASMFNEKEYGKQGGTLRLYRISNKAKASLQYQFIFVFLARRIFFYVVL